MATKEKDFLNYYLKHVYEYGVKEKRNIILFTDIRGKTNLKIDMKNNWNTNNSLSDFLSICQDKSIANLYCGNLSTRQKSHIFYQAWENAEIEEKKKLSLHFHKLVDRFEYEYIDFFTLLKKQQDNEDIDIFLKYAPSTVLNSANEITNVFKYIKARHQDSDKEIMLNFLMKRKSLIIKNEKLYVTLINDLKQYYDGDNILEEYAQYFPKMKAELKAKDSDGVFYQMEEKEITLMIDYDRVKAVGHLSSNNYEKWLESFLSVFSLKDKRIQNIQHSDFKLSNRKEYKNIFIYVKDNHHVSEMEIKEIIVDFIKSLTPAIDQKHQDTSGKKSYIKDWLHHQNFKKELEENAQNKSSTQFKL